MPRTPTIDSAEHPRFAAPDFSGDGLDADALARFLHHGDSAAFEVIVRRHGPSVLRECRKVLGPGADAEDAFQTTFVVLVRNARSIRQADALGAWLRGVARRVATKARVRAKLLRDREVAGVDVEAASNRDDHLDVELRPALRAEVDRLPEKYRAPIELCYWRGLSNEQAAEALSCPTGTVKWRLARGREILRGRLVRSGLTLLALLMFWRRPALGASVSTRAATPPGGDPVSAALTDDLVRRTLAAAIRARNGLAPITTLASRSVVEAAAKRGRMLRPWRILVIVTVAATALAAIPAVRAAFFSRAPGNWAATTPMSWPAVPPATQCSDSPATAD